MFATIESLLLTLAAILYRWLLPKDQTPQEKRALIQQKTQLSEIDGGPLSNRASVLLHLEQGLATSLHKPAIISTHQPATHLQSLLAYCDDIESANAANGQKHGDCLTLSYQQLHSLATELAVGLLETGVQPGSTILMLIPNGAEFGLLLWTSVIARITVTCADPDALGAAGAGELQYTLQSLKPSVVVVADAETALAVDNAVGSLSLAKPLGLCTSSAVTQLSGWSSLGDIMAESAVSSTDRDDLLEQARNDDPQRVHSILFTSGSSGRPKGCPLRVSAQTHYMHSQGWLVDRKAAPFALQQAHPSRGITHLQTLLTWKAGGTVVMTGRGFNVSDVADVVRQFPISFVALSPPMVHEISDVVHKGALDTSSVRTVQVGGDAVNKGMLLKASSVFPCARVVVAHGMTEGGGSFYWPFSNTPLSQIPYFGGLCPVGAVAPGSVVRIWNPEEKRLCKRGEAGALHACSGSLIHHYMFRASEASFYNDKWGRWFVTGDHAVMSDDGIVSVLGRSKDVIKRDGVAIMPAPLENCIESFTGQQTVVVAIPHKTLGQEPYAVTSSLGGKTAEEVNQHVSRALGDEYRLSGLLTLDDLGFDRFPVNATHKIVKHDVYKAVMAQKM